MAKPQARQVVKRKWIETGQALPEQGGGQPPRLAAGAIPPKRWTLTEEFNRAAQKPQAAKTPDARKQIADLRKKMEAAAKGTGQDNQQRAPHQAIASKQGIELLRRQKMSQPRNTWELTPLGSVKRGYHPQRDRRISKEIARQQAVLDRNQGKAKTAFNQSAGLGR